MLVMLTVTVMTALPRSNRNLDSDGLPPLPVAAAVIAAVAVVSIAVVMAVVATVVVVTAVAAESGEWRAIEIERLRR